MHESWKSQLKSEFEKPYYKDLMEFVDKAYEEKVCFPPKAKIFEAFNLCAFEDVKVVILGQDPYHGPGEAHGLCFSVNKGVKIPPSLRNIFKEIQTDLNQEIPNHGNLEHWARQGVLMLNATLTVEQKKAGSHQRKGWEQFTDAVIHLISSNKQDVVFLLWGNYAKKKGKLIDEEKHVVLKSGHPSPMSANKGHWFGNTHFSQTNAFLKSKGKKAINW